MNARVKVETTLAVIECADCAMAFGADAIDDSQVEFEVDDATPAGEGR